MEVQSCTAGKVGTTDLHFPDLPVALSELRFQDSHRTSQLAVSKLFETAVPKNRNPTFRTPEVHFSAVGIGTSVLLCGLLHFRLLHFRTFALSPLLSHFRLPDAPRALEVGAWACWGLGPGNLQHVRVFDDLNTILDLSWALLTYLLRS